MIPPKPAPTQAPPTQPRAGFHRRGTPETPIEVAITRALDQELDWFFAYAEGALHREDVAILPSYAAVRILATSPTDEDVPREGRAGRRTRFLVQVSLGSLRAPHASVLRAAYTPRRWPRLVRSEFKHLSGVAVRLTLGEEIWPPRPRSPRARGGGGDARLSFTLANATSETADHAPPRACRGTAPAGRSSRTAWPARRPRRSRLRSLRDFDVEEFLLRLAISGGAPRLQGISYAPAADREVRRAAQRGTPVVPHADGRTRAGLVQRAP